MKREREEELRSGRGTAPSIFFVDLSSLSRGVQALYVLGLIGFFALIFYVLINKVFGSSNVNFNKQKKQER